MEHGLLTLHEGHYEVLQYFAPRIRPATAECLKKAISCDNAEFIAAKAKQATEARDEAALVVEEVEEVDMAEDEEGNPALSTVSTLVTRTEALQEVNGKPLVPTIELRSCLNWRL
jgi:hypothetical protein